MAQLCIGAESLQGRQSFQGRVAAIQAAGRWSMWMVEDIV